MVRLSILGAIALFAFQLYCLLDAITAEPMTIRNLPKVVWMLLILLFPLLGGIAWLVAGRPERAAVQTGGRPTRSTRGGRARRAQPPRPRGPDDDPDFLRSLERRRRHEDDERA